jgi:hypothetical protein
MSWISIIPATAAAFSLRIIAVLAFVTGIAVLLVGLTSTFIPNNFVSLGYLLSGGGLSLAIPAGRSMIANRVFKRWHWAAGSTDRNCPRNTS